MTTYKNTADEAKRFFESFVYTFYEKRDYECCLQVLDESISWFGTGAHEVCHNTHDAIRLLSAEQSSFDGHFSVAMPDVRVTTISSTAYAVYGICYIKDTNNLSLYLQEMATRVSLICNFENNNFVIKHVHASVPNSAQGEDDFIQKTVDKQYDRLLEKTLEERTKLLRQTTIELEALTNNIYGGVEICQCDDALTITYISDGFTALSGYTKEVLQSKFGSSHYELVHEKDREAFTEKCRDVMANGEYGKGYAFEYRLVHKDGHFIWVLDNAVKQKGDKCDQFQCILTDITDQKEQQFALRLSEKRYEIAMAMSELVMFEYNIVTRQLILYERDRLLYNVNKIVENGVETFIATGIVEPDSVEAFRGMYNLVCAGAKSASCFIHARDAMGKIHDYEMQLNTVFDDEGRPIKAIGLRKNVSQLRRLEKEREFANTLVSGKIFLFEADISRNCIIDVSEYWKATLNITIDMPLNHAIDLVCDGYVDPEHRETIRHRTSLQYIQQKFAKGEKLIVFSYKRKDERGEYAWFEGTLNIIRDDLADSLHMRFYHTNINERKVKEQRALEEQRLYENFTSHATLSYEVNITKNQAIKGHENWEAAYGIIPTESYSEMISAFAVCGIYAEDAKGFVDSFCVANVLASYGKGERQIVCKYRKPTGDGELHWVCCTLNLYEDPNSGDIKGYSYVEDIDEKMRAEIALKYKADHDTMTGLYNKVTTQAIIEAFLADETYTLKQHAFLMIDIDFFKSVNDTFGHLFGDDVLRDVAARIKSIFREDDIIGRIGGDEFVVLMKKVTGTDIVAQKAQEVCEQLRIEYRIGTGTASISASVGIAMYPKNGINFASLCAHADKALYTSKNNGKNSYAW